MQFEKRASALLPGRSDSSGRFYKLVRETLIGPHGRLLHAEKEALLVRSSVLPGGGDHRGGGAIGIYKWHYSGLNRWHGVGSTADFQKIIQERCDTYTQTVRPGSR